MAGITDATSPLTVPVREIDRAVAACADVSRAVRDDLLARPTWAATARTCWAGVHRRTFDATEAELYRRLGELHDGLRALERSLREGREALLAENARRAERRAEVEAEHRRGEEATAP